MKTTIIIGRIASIGKIIDRASGNDVAEIIVYNTIFPRWKTEHKQYHRVIASGTQGQTALSCLEKGDLVCVEGNLCNIDCLMTLSCTHMYFLNKKRRALQSEEV
jgi:single-stranded DNA-binding protein